MHQQWLDRDNFSTFLCFYIIFVHEKYLLVHPRMVDFSGKVQFITFDQSHPLKGCRSQKSLSDNKRPMKSLKIMIMDKKTHPKLYKLKLCKQSATFSIIVYFLSCKIYAWLNFCTMKLPFIKTAPVLHPFHFVHKTWEHFLLISQCLYSDFFLFLHSAHV